MVDIDPALLSDEVERVNITLPKRILARLDSKALQYGKTRSGLIADWHSGSPDNFFKL